MSSPVFAVGVDEVQLVWPRLRGGRRRVTVGEVEAEVEGSADGPVAAWVAGLPAGAALDVRLDGRLVGVAHTLRRPSGVRRARVATISDLHVGQAGLGRLPRFDDPPNLRTAAAALEEIASWGPDLVVVKGDLTDHGAAGEWEAVGALLRATGLPVVATPGNHDVRYERRADGRPILGRFGVELTPPGGVVVRDLDGLRVVAADTTVAGTNRGSLAGPLRGIVDAVTTAPAPTLVALHHHLMPLPAPYFWPPGIRPAEGRALARGLGQHGRRVLLTSGHTHRHRHRPRHGIAATEVGAVRDFPGGWAAYEAYDGGLTQVVRRTAAPDTLRFTQATARTAAGVWGRWSPGRLGDRCLTVTWT